jgi:preprotein translocase subunit SecD
MKTLLILIILILPALNIFSQVKHFETGLYLVIPSDSCTGPNNKNAVRYMNDTLCLEPKPVITVKDFEYCDTAESKLDGQEMFVLDIQLKDSSALKFKKITTKNVGKRFAFIIDNKVVMAPVIRDPITSGRMTVSGDTKAYIKEMYEKLEKEMGKP